jgi:hypothetical protein
VLMEVLTRMVVGRCPGRWSYRASREDGAAGMIGAVSVDREVHQESAAPAVVSTTAEN